MDDRQHHSRRWGRRVGRVNRDEVKRAERESYDRVAEAWTANVAGMTALYSRRLLDLIVPAPGSALLDLACGAGHMAADAALRFQCRVTGLDLSEGMLKRAAAGVRVCGDAERLPFRDASFDTVVCGLGVMYFPDARAALDEIRRVLRPGGSVGFVVWADPHRVACLRIAIPAIAEATARAPLRWLLGLPRIGERLLFRAIEERVPGFGPSPFRFARPGKIQALLSLAGFRDIYTAEDTVVWRYSGFDAFWREFVRSTPAPAGRPKDTGEIRRRMERKSRAYVDEFREMACPMTAVLVRAAR